jgi:mRNA interferase RelE/StbE
MVFFPAEFSPQAGKFVKKLDPVTKKRIREKVSQLEQDPFLRQAVRVEDYRNEKIFRVRVGDYRILYLVRHNPPQLFIVKLDKRERVYD